MFLSLGIFSRFDNRVIQIEFLRGNQINKVYTFMLINHNYHVIYDNQHE